MKDSLVALPYIKPKKFRAKEFAKVASQVAKILEEEREQAVRDQLIKMNENYYTSRFL